MLSRVNQSELPSYQIGLEQGIEKGVKKGIGKGIAQEKEEIVTRLISKRFGPLTEANKARIAAASKGELDQWVDNMFDAQSLDQVFQDKE